VGLGFLTPAAAVFAALALTPLGMFVSRQRRLTRIRASLRLEPPTRRSRIPLAVCLTMVPILVGVAAAQPVVTSARTVPERSDAEIFVVLDTSRSMLASSSPDADTRFERARNDALALQSRLPDVPVGIASLTDRLLPHLFPTVDQRVFSETMRDAVGIERPPPSMSFGTKVTTLDALGAVPTLGYFRPQVKKRALVVFTDGESQPVTSVLSSDFSRRPRIDVTFVRMGDASQRIYETGVAEAGYRPDPTAGAILATAAASVRGRVLDEGDVDGVAAAVRNALGRGPTVGRRIEGHRRALMPYVAMLVFVPLGFVLLRRNL
jgi:hypothetical protein